MAQLDEVYKQCQNSEHRFRHKAVLFIGCESYEAATITVLQGLHKLGFSIYTIRKPNINSWFCNRIVESLDRLKFDFVLSNLAWGTRWSYYKHYKLDSYLKVPIDGTDNHGKESWKQKYARYTRTYVYDPSEALKDAVLCPCRWVEPLKGYEPDVVFTSQKVPADQSSLYLPFGIHEQYRALHQGRSTVDRNIDFAHIPGPGARRKRMQRFVTVLARDERLPGLVHNRQARGEEVAPAQISQLVAGDRNVHSYHRWTMSKAYFRILNQAKVLIYPGVTDAAHWDSKRPWEAYASGCLVLLARPNIDVKGYPITEVCEFAVYDSMPEFIAKCRHLYEKPDFLDKSRVNAVRRAWKHFSPCAIARHFLTRVARHMGLA